MDRIVLFFYNITYHINLIMSTGQIYEIDFIILFFEEWPYKNTFSTTSYLYEVCCYVVESHYISYYIVYNGQMSPTPRLSAYIINAHVSPGMNIILLCIQKSIFLILKILWDENFIIYFCLKLGYRTS